MLFVFNFISLFVLNGFNISKAFNAKVMDHKIRFYSYFISFFVSELFHFIMSMWDTIITSFSVTTSNLNTREIWNINSDHKHEHPNRNLDHNHNQMQIPDYTPHTIPEPVTRHHTRQTPIQKLDARLDPAIRHQIGQQTRYQIRPNTTTHTRPVTRYHSSHQSSNQISDRHYTPD